MNPNFALDPQIPSNIPDTKKCEAKFGMNIFKQLLEFVYPAFCEICDSKLKPAERYICRFCLSRVREHPSPFCQKSYGRLSRVWAWAIYESVMKECLHLLKYRQKEYLLDAFRKPLIEFFQRNSIMKHVDILTPVPLHISKLRYRTFNQAHIIAGIPASHYGIPLANLLTKNKDTSPQHNLNKHEREKNIKGSFVVEDKRLIHQKRILIVDDILTTGATISECAKVLLDAGAGKVYGFAMTRGN